MAMDTSYVYQCIIPAEDETSVNDVMLQMITVSCLVISYWIIITIHAGELIIYNTNTLRYTGIHTHTHTNSPHIKVITV